MRRGQSVAGGPQAFGSATNMSRCAYPPDICVEHELHFPAELPMARAGNVCTRSVPAALHEPRTGTGELFPLAGGLVGRLLRAQGEARRHVRGQRDKQSRSDAERRAAPGSRPRIVVTAISVSGLAAAAHGTRIRPGGGASQQPVSEADVQFMSGMIPHHAQAVLIAQWAPAHGARTDLKSSANASWWPRRRDRDDARLAARSRPEGSRRDQHQDAHVDERHGARHADARHADRRADRRARQGARRGPSIACS